MRVLSILKSLTLGAVVLLASCTKPVETASISASPNKVTISGDGETVNVAISVKGATEWGYKDAPKWVTIAVEGNSMAISAEANTTGEVLTGTIVIYAGNAQSTIEITQGKASKYPGFTELTSADILFAGAMYQLPIFGFENCEGSQFLISLASEDGRSSLYLELFTELYASEEDVELTAGTYTAGDDYATAIKNPQSVQGTPMTWMKGGEIIVSDEEGDESIGGGSVLSLTSGDIEEIHFLKDGSIEISYPKEGGICIKCELKDADGNEYKYYYQGEYEPYLEDALYPSEGETLIGGALTYEGDSEDGSKSNFSLMLMTSSMNVANIQFVTPKTDATELKVAGTYSTTDNTMIPGYMEKYEEDGEEFDLPAGTYWTVNFVVSHIADDASEMTIAVNEDGTFNLSISLKEKSGSEFSFSIEGTELEIADATTEGGWDDEE